MNNFLYFPGCTLSTTAKKLDEYAKKSAEVLGFTLTEVDEWQCCGAIYPSRDETAKKLSAVRVLIKAQNAGLPLVTLCSACFHIFKQVNFEYNNSDLPTVIRTYDPDLNYGGKTKILHYIEVIRDVIGFDSVKEKITNPIKGKIGAYYGCMLLRPSEVMEFDDPENPSILEDFLRVIGAEPVNYSYRNECCGSFHSIKNPENVKNQCKAIMNNAIKKEATELITACPLCEYNLNNFSSNGVKITYFTELLAQALGIGGMSE